MRHANRRHRLNRYTSWRKATLISMARSILIYQSVKTTMVKAKAVRPLIDKLISLGKENTLAAKRRAFAILQDHKLVQMLFSDIAPRFSARSGGYTRILRYGVRRGDSADLTIMELTEVKKIDRKKKTAKAPKAEAHSHETPAHEPKPAEPKHEAKPAAKEPKPELEGKKPVKKFLGGLKTIFKKQKRAF